MDANRRHAAAVVTVSDGVSAGTRQDRSGAAVASALAEHGFDVVRREVVPDERGLISRLLAELCDAEIALVATTGGTGLGPRDVTPEATRDVIERDAPGLAEAMRAAGRAATPLAALSRGAAGARGRTLILNLPGSERGARESLEAVLLAIPHALDLLAGRTAHDDSPPPARADGRHDHRRGSPVPEAAETPPGLRVTATAVKVHGDPPCRVGQRLLIGAAGPVGGTLGCAEFDAAAAADAPRVAASGTPETKTYAHELGSIEVYLEPAVRQPRLVVYSATPVAAHIVRWARDVGFHPVVVEPRSDRPGLPGVDVARSGDDVDVDGDTYAVLTDHDAPGVAGSLARLLRSPVAFVGVMGSRRHVGPYVEELRAMGFGEDDLSRIRTPLGIDIGARTAEEIALSILAGVVAARHGANGGWLDDRSGAP